MLLNPARIVLAMQMIVTERVRKMAKIIRCDRCGKELPQKDWLEFPLCKIEIMANLVEDIKQIDLCDSCKRDFDRWLKGE